MNIVCIKINKPIHGHPLGSIARVRADDDGVPIEKYWRDRLRDAVIDDCVEIVKATRKTPNKTAEKR